MGNGRVPFLARFFSGSPLWILRRLLYPKSYVSDIKGLSGDQIIGVDIRITSGNA